MKNVAALAFILLAGCNQKKDQHSSVPADTAIIINKATNDSGLPAHNPDAAIIPVPANKLVLPGKSIGLTAIGQTAEETGKHLGRPDEGDAAMGKSLSTWYSKNNPAYKTQVFSVIQMGTEETIPRVKSIRVNNPFFETATHIKAGSVLKEIVGQFPALVLSGSYQAPGNKSIKLYDDTNAGIAFEIDDNNMCVGICVHTTGEKAFMQYLPFEPGFESIND